MTVGADCVIVWYIQNAEFQSRWFPVQVQEQTTAGDVTMKLSRDDEYIWTTGYKKVPKEKLNIPCLHMIGQANFNKAWDALDTHYHNMLEVVVVLNGSQQYVVNDRMYALYGGKMFITHPNEIHGNGKMPQNVCDFIWFQLDISSSVNFLGLSGDKAEYLHSRIARCKRRTMDVGHRDLELLQDAWNLLTTEEPSKQMQGYACFLQFLSIYFCDDRQDQHDRGVSPDIQRAVQFIQDNLTSDLRLSDIANACNISESHFKSKFRMQMGITPLGYITSQKIEKAKKLLKGTGDSITDIALQLNFSSSNYFSSVFKQYTGYSPTEFRYAKMIQQT